MDLDHCLGEWEQITREYEEAENDREKKSQMMWKVLEFRRKFRDMLNNEGPGADERFRKEMEVMRMERDYLLSGIPKIKKGIINLPTPSQERLLNVIKDQADRFDASGVQPRPGEWTVSHFYKELKAACDEANEQGTPKAPMEKERDLSPETSFLLLLDKQKPAKLILPPGARVVAATDESEGSQASCSTRPSRSRIQEPSTSAIAADSDTLFIDIACLLKLFTAVSSVPRAFLERPPASQATGAADPDGAAGHASTSAQAHTETNWAAQIAKMDCHILKLERAKQRIKKSITKIKITLGEVIGTESESDEEDEPYSESDEDSESDVDMSE